ncbi:hypothetical protein I203_106989 [Kwoniella mangroviensis CBS 8507]|uniref:hypothetical protein n=1 Tax=Kwoniella mangroviensis CBS 8507 TaxID=1296122 RepID=UPI00080CEE4F|nr:uncharacterized protein I203_01738 [Kwoniella mangroviensis CBS 8507]OCF68358.1 hypothetical protein I203_01738 [Kwoniella mangroviensis CBS 8507]
MRVEALIPVVAFMAAQGATAAPVVQQENLDKRWCLFGIIGTSCGGSSTVVTTSAAAKSSTIAASSSAKVSVASSASAVKAATTTITTAAPSSTAAWSSCKDFDWSAWGSNWSWGGYNLDYVKAWYVDTYGLKPPPNMSWNQVSSLVNKYGHSTSASGAKATSVYKHGCSNPWTSAAAATSTAKVSTTAAAAASTSKAVSSAAAASSAKASASAVAQSSAAAASSVKASAIASSSAAASNASVSKAPVAASSAAAASASASASASKAAVSAAPVVSSAAVASSAAAPVVSSAAVASSAAAPVVSSAAAAASSAAAPVVSSAAASASATGVPGNGSGSNSGTGVSGTATTSSAAPATTTTAAVTINGFTAGGCVQEVSGRLLSKVQTSSSSMTIEQCTTLCGNYGYGVAGLEYGNECYCGAQDDIDDALVSGQCYMPCAGDSTETCGGPNAINVFINPDITPDVINLPDGWSTYGTVAEGTNGRALTYTLWSSSTNTVESCAAGCAAAGYSIAGTEYSAECYCGNSFSNGGGAILSDDAAFMACSGDLAQMCGGPSVLSVVSSYTGTIPSS